MQESCPCGTGQFLVGGGVSLWKGVCPCGRELIFVEKHILAGGGVSVIVRGLTLCEGVCPCGRGYVLEEGGLSSHFLKSY